MASKTVHKQTLARIVRSLLVLVPAAAGTGAAALALLQGELTGMLSFLGIAGLSFAAGAAATQLVLGMSPGARSVREDSVDTARKNHEKYLTDLLGRLRRDRDDRTEEILDRLHRLNDRLQIDGLLDSETGLAPEIRAKVEHLYRSCLRSLERSWDFWSAAMEMSTREVRQEMLDRREQILTEVQESTAHLETTVDYLRAKQLSRALDEIELTQIRQELDVGLTVARRVEEHMSELENALTARPHEDWE
jgi:hypothetical protein